MKTKKSPRLKVLRGIEPNAGLRVACAKRINTALKRLSTELRKQALKSFRAGDSFMASPGFISMVATEMRFMPEGRELLSLPQDVRPPQLTQDAWLTPAQRSVIKACARAFIRFGLDAKDVSHWFCRRMLYRTTDDMLKALEKAHVSRALIRQNWRVPYIKDRYIAPSTAEQLPEKIRWMTELITKMSATSTKKVQQELARALDQGQSYSQLRATLMGLENMDTARAERVARDQSCKLNQFIQQENARSLGIQEGIWIHVPGMFMSRETHKAMDGKKFNLRQGMFDDSEEAGGRYVMPGELPFCRCVYQAVIPDSLLE